MKALILRTFVTMIAVIGALLLVPGMAIEGRVRALGIAVAMGILNAILRPMLIRLSIGCSILTLAPILLIINTMIFYIFGKMLNMGIMVEGFWPAFWGGLLVSIAAYSMMFLVSDGL